MISSSNQAEPLATHHIRIAPETRRHARALGALYKLYQRTRIFAPRLAGPKPAVVCVTRSALRFFVHLLVCAHAHAHARLSLAPSARARAHTFNSKLCFFLRQIDAQNALSSVCGGKTAAHS